MHTFGCGHATLPIEEMYPRIGGFVGFHPMIELPLSFFTHITGEMGVHQFVFLERVEGYGVEIMKGYNFDPRDTMWLFSHSGINNVNIDVAIEAKKKGMKVIAFGSAAAQKENKRDIQAVKQFLILQILLLTPVHLLKMHLSRSKITRINWAGFHNGFCYMCLDDCYYRCGNIG